jgi:hypothetical protein
VSTEHLFPTVIDIRDEEVCKAFLEEVAAKHGHPIYHAVSTFGQFWEGGEKPLRREVQALEGMWCCAAGRARGRRCSGRRCLPTARGCAAAPTSRRASHPTAVHQAR